MRFNQSLFCLALTSAAIKNSAAAVASKDEAAENHERVNDNRSLGKATPKIINGSPASPGEYPYFATRGTSRFVCGASLVAPDILLTAAHCENAFVSDALVGAYKMSSTAEGAQYVDIAEKIVHPGHVLTATENKHDIMVVKLKRSVNKRRIRLNLDPNKPEFNQPLMAIGMGKTSDATGSFSGTLMEARLFETTDALCWQSWGPIVDTHICAWDTSPLKTTCGGDSGSPLIDLSTDTLVGIVSYGPQSCQAGELPAVFARVSLYAEWLKDTICTKSSSPPPYLCGGSGGQAGTDGGAQSTACRRRNQACSNTQQCCNGGKKFKCEGGRCKKCSRKRFKCKFKRDCCNGNAKCKKGKCSK